ncbi:hypothetical protein, partial [Tritonibacter scottomollicae]|uniref:hypothetical protein n=1 Tax=Tritonibacter scottomollicae TaxID=483013 RepID=UPI003BAC59CC
NLSQLQHDVLGLLSFACHLVVLLKTGYSYPKRWTTSVGALQVIAKDLRYPFPRTSRHCVRQRRFIIDVPYVDDHHHAHGVMR